ncbi:hypothetical protein B0H14DRAFT_1466496 [Mycena olivaceomarginata]|nr:hypothetical protein B0H14DRAFT_1466496 [Mycena olivaceomarginata]
MEGVEASSNKKWGNRECGRSRCAEGQTSARPVSPPSLLARARAHAVGAPDASSANRHGCPLRLALTLNDVPMLMFMLRRCQRRGVRVLRPPDARREGVRLSRCRGGASGGERRGRSGRVQLDVGAAGVQRGYGHRRRQAHTVAGACAAAPRALFGSSFGLGPRRRRALRKRATVAKAEHPRAGGTRHGIQVAVLRLPPPDIHLVLNLEARSPALIWGREEPIQYMTPQ